LIVITGTSPMQAPGAERRSRSRLCDAERVFP
jgi:hypothetical protein